MKCRGIQCFDFLLAKKLVGFQWRAGTTPSPGAAAKCCKAATSECMKSSPGYHWHPSFTVPKWCQKFIKNSVTSWTCKDFHVYIHNYWQLGSSSQLTMAFSRDAPWNVWQCYQNLPQKLPPRRTSEPGTSIFQLPEEKELRIKFASHPLQIRLPRGLKKETNFRM